MFEGCSALTSPNVDLSKATDISNIFSGCESLSEFTAVKSEDEYSDKRLNPSLQKMSGAFRGCTSLTRCILDFNGSSSAKDMSHMFEGCSSLGKSGLELNNINVGSGCDTTDMFRGAASANGEGTYWNAITTYADAADIFDDPAKTGIDTGLLRFSVQHHIKFHTYDDVIESDILDGRTIREAKLDDVQGSRPYYDFAGWYTDEKLTHPFSIDTPVTEDMELYAKWARAGSTDPDKDETKPDTGADTGQQTKEYKITFDSNGGSAVASQTVKAGSKAQRPEDPERKGYIFAGWYTDSSLTHACDFGSAVNSDMTLYARWTSDPSAAAGGSSGLLKLRVFAKGTSQTLKWSGIDGADGYEVYFAKCGSRYKRVRTTKSLSLTRRGLKRGREYSCYVNAYKYSNGKKVYISTSLICHSIAGGHSRTRTNAKKVVVSPNSLTLQKGGRVTIAPRTRKAYKSLKLLRISHCPKYRYQSSDTKIAGVRNGVITARRTGTCTVYVFAQNGARAAVKVTVEQ